MHFLCPSARLFASVRARTGANEGFCDLRGAYFRISYQEIPTLAETAEQRRQQR